MSLMRISAVDYVIINEGDDGYTADPETVLRVAGRGLDGKRRTHYVHGTNPFMYVPEGTSIPEPHHGVTDYEEGYHATDPDPNRDGTALTKWICETPDDVGELKESLDCPTWEADIPYYRRASISYGLSGYVDMPEEDEVDIADVDTDPDRDADTVIEPRIVYGDIEVMVGDNSVEQMLEQVDQPITAITLYDSHEEQYDIYVLNPDDGVGFDAEECRQHLVKHRLDPADTDVVVHKSRSEVGLLKSFLGYFEDRRPDLTTGWNWVNFDMKYLIRRITELGEKENSLDLRRWSDFGEANSNVGDYHGDLARAITGVPAVDMMQLFFERIELSEWRSKSLEYVSQELLDYGKVSDVNVNEGYQNDRAKLAAYNAVDVKLCVDIDEARDVIETCLGLAEECHVQIYDVFSEMRLVDGYIMSRSDDDEVLPNQSESDIPPNDGGLVLEASSGIKEWVGVMDLKSLYPSCMITWNISPETVHWMDGDKPPLGTERMRVPWVTPSDELSYPITDDDISWDRLWTEMSEEGIVPKYLKRLFKNRAEAKEARDSHKPGTLAHETWDRRQYGLKVLMNSFYGVSSNDYWRMAKDGLGDAITSAARYSLFLGKEAITDAGYDVIYGDTDSCFFSLERKDPPATDEEYKERATLDGKGLTSQVNATIESGIRECGLSGEHPYLDGTLPHDKGCHCIHYEFEKLYRRYIQFGKKKRYAGLVVWKEGKDVDSVDVTGFEATRSDTPELAAEAQEEVLHMVLDGEGFDGVSDYVSGLVDDIRNENVDIGRIARPKALRRAKEDYANQNSQVLRACRFSERQLDKSWVKGDDPWLVYLDGTPPGRQSVSVIALGWNDELPDGYDLDAEEHIRICLELPLAPILDEVGWNWREVKNAVQVGDAMSGDWDGEQTDSSTPNGVDSSENEGGSVLESDW